MPSSASSPRPSKPRALSARPGESELGLHTPPQARGCCRTGGREETLPLMPILSPADNPWQMSLPEAVFKGPLQQQPQGQQQQQHSPARGAANTARLRMQTWHGALLSFPRGQLSPALPRQGPGRDGRLGKASARGRDAVPGARSIPQHRVPSGTAPASPQRSGTKEFPPTPRNSSSFCSAA